MVAALVTGSRLFFTAGTSFCRHRRPAAVDGLAQHLAVVVHGQAHAQAVLGVVFEQRVAPGRAAAVFALAIGNGREGAAVDRGASGGIGDDHAFAKKLGDQLDVGGLAAAAAGAGELEQRLTELAALRTGRSWVPSMMVVRAGHRRTGCWRPRRPGARPARGWNLRGLWSWPGRDMGRSCRSRCSPRS